MQYNDPNNTPSTIGNQIRTDYYQKKALIELKKEQYFSPLADTVTMPKHFGKKISVYHYLPLLDVRNNNDQGIDAAGATISPTTYEVRAPQAVCYNGNTDTSATATTKAHLAGELVFCTGTNVWYQLIANRAIGSNLTTADTLKSDAAVKAIIDANTSGITAAVVSGAGISTITLTGGQSLVYSTLAAANLAANAIGGSVVTQRSGNLYGSSKDIGTIAAKLPAISETGGRVNRVGFKRIQHDGTLAKFGFFEEYTQESLDFDTDAQLEEHINREMLRAANEMTEDALQIDLINNAGTIRYAGSATSNATVSGATGNVCEVTYNDFSRLAIMLDDNRTPKQTKVITGSRMVDTKTIAAGRVMFIGSELVPTLERLTDFFSNSAFIPVQRYAAAGETLNGEIGSVGAFRIVVVPEMMHWDGVGAAEGVNNGYRVSSGRYNVYPMLVVGDGSFTTIGFYTDGKSVKFKIFHKKPGLDTVDKTDPFGESGLMSIKWYYGFMALRPERIALIKTVARV